MPPEPPNIYDVAGDLREVAGASGRNATHIEKIYERLDSVREDVTIIKTKMAFMAVLFGMGGGVAGSVVGGLILWMIKGK